MSIEVSDQSCSCSWVNSSSDDQKQVSLIDADSSFCHVKTVENKFCRSSLKYWGKERTDFEISSVDVGSTMKCQENKFDAQMKN